MEDLQKQIDELKAQIKLLESSGTIPYNVEQAFRTRLDVASTISGSTKVSSSENQAVDEAGSATYNVLKSPDGFLKTTVGGTTVYLPYFT